MTAAVQQHQINQVKSKPENQKPSSFFYNYGRICAMYPCEVIFAVITMATCFITIDRQQNHDNSKMKSTPCKGCLHEAEYNAASVIVMTIVRCVAILYSYYQLRNLCRLNSKYILIISGAFTMFSSFIFTTTLINYLHTDIADLKDAIFFFLLLVDLSKTCMLAQFALSSSTHEDIKENIAKGMSILGPTITLDMVVETLLLSVGTLSGIPRLEMLSYFACLSIIVNYVVFMTFYPACLCFILELSRYGDQGRSVLGAFSTEDDHKVNPVVQRVKVIMSCGLLIVHLHSRYVSQSGSVGNHDDAIQLKETNYETGGAIELSPMNEFVLKWITLSLDHIVILIIIISLTVKFVFFKEKTMLDDDDTSEQNMTTSSSLNFDSFEKSSVFTDEQEDVACEQLLEDQPRDLATCLQIYKMDKTARNLSDKEVILLVQEKVLPAHQLENLVEDPMRGVKIRRKIMLETAFSFTDLSDLPVENYDYKKVLGACCENVLGYVPIPVGVVGPLKLDSVMFHVPMATTEGCLVASTNRGCRALYGSGVTSRVVADGMTRGPVVRFSSLKSASEAMQWLQDPANYEIVKSEFDSTSNYARLSKIQVKIAGRYLFIRFVATTGDAMGMNMLSKGTERVLSYIHQNHFPEMEILSVSGNFCSDKKSAAINWIEGRGKSVVCDAVIPAQTIQNVLKTTVQALVDVNISKNLVGSAVAGSIGGFNAHAANIVTAIFIATGQDPAQNVSSSQCLTLMEPCGVDGRDLYVSCTMPSLEVGTVGGGTVLPAQSCCLQMLGARGAHADRPGAHAEQLARVICATVLAGEVSLMAALAAGHLVSSHLRYNRK